MDQVLIFDTTLRDGEQSPGISLDVGEKLEIAEQLARLGVDVIEAGFPIASDGDFEAVEAIAKSVKGPIIAGLSRTGFKDVDRAWEAVRHAERNRIHIFLATSELHMKKKLRMTHDQVKAEVAASVARAKGYTADVEYSPEDGFRSDPDFMCEVCQIAVDNGATTLNIPDTVGYGLPEDFGKLIAYVIDTVQGEFVVSTHCHNDLGLAVANSLAGVANGARQVECAINGLGERAGNAALEEVVMAIRTRSDYFEGITTGVRTEELAARVTDGVAPDRLPGPVQQGGRRPERVRARGRHPPARRARGPRDLRDHGRGRGGPGGRADRAGQALRPARVRRLAGEDGPAPAGRRAEPGVRPVQGAGRPQGPDHRGGPRGDRGRGARHRRRAQVHRREPRRARRHAVHARRRRSC